MLVDLGRNDLGRVSKIGTVEVTDYMMIHRYSKIMHICSQVEGDIDEKYDACDAIEAVLPAGTLSGAPKIRACEIIEEQESEPRGVYGGALGYLDFTGNMDTCIAIRMAAKKNGTVTVQAGGMDEASLIGRNKVCEIHDGKLTPYEFDPTEYGLSLCTVDDLRGGSPKANAQITRDILSGNAHVR